MDGHSFAVAERIRIAQTLARDTAIDMVSTDPAALAACLSRVGVMVSTPTLRATAWRDVRSSAEPRVDHETAAIVNKAPDLTGALRAPPVQVRSE